MTMFIVDHLSKQAFPKLNYLHFSKSTRSWAATMDLNDYATLRKNQLRTECWCLSF